MYRSCPRGCRHSNETKGLIVLNALRLSFGTFTGIRVKAPVLVNRDLMGKALTLSFLPALLVSGGAWSAGYLAFRSTQSSLVAAVIVVGVEIMLTAGLHIDGLLDSADGMAAFSKSGRERALEIMKVGNSGPSAFATGFITLFLQVAALSMAIANGLSVNWIICGLMARLVVVLSCRVGAKPARPDGLGNPFIGSIGLLSLIGSVASYLVIIFILGVGQQYSRIVVAVLVSLIYGEVLKRVAEKRFGGLTGDFLGSFLEKTRTISLLILILSV